MTIPQYEPARWSQMQERGTYYGLSILLWVYRCLGLKTVHFLLHFIVGFYFVFGGAARAASLQYLRAMHDFMADKSPWKKAPGLWQSFRHFISFSYMAVDKIVVWLGHYNKDDLIMEGYDKFQAYQNEGKGCVLIVSHLGNVDICRAIGGTKNIPLTVLVHSAHAQNFQKIMTKVSGAVPTSELIEVQNMTPDIAMRLKAKVDEGGNIAISGDRTPVDNAGRNEIVPFLGQPAPFAQGAFILAGLLDCPVFAVFATKERQKYRMCFEFIAPTLHVDRKERAKNLKVQVVNYAKILERHACAAPLQWFNFYDYWGQAPEQNRKTGSR